MKKNVYKGLALLLMAAMLVGCGSAGGNTENDTQKDSQALTETESELATESEEPEPVVSTVTITATGDCALGVLETHGYQGSFHSYYDSYGEAYFFEKFKEVFENETFLEYLENLLKQMISYLHCTNSYQFFSQHLPHLAHYLQNFLKNWRIIWRKS